MKAAVLHELGGVPRYEEFGDPQPAGDEALVQVTAAALKPVDRAMAGGSHYAAYRELPAVCGSDGAGRLADGTRVFFYATRRPYGGLAERTVVPPGRLFTVPDQVGDAAAAAVFSPGMAAWKAVLWRGELAPGQTVLILGATGSSGRIAVQMARRHGAGLVVAAGRDAAGLERAAELGADVTIQLGQAGDALAAAFAAAAGTSGYDLVVDYVWGRPAEVLFRALTQPGLIPDTVPARTRYVQVGQSAGEMAALSANALRSTNLEIVGSGSGAIPSAAGAQGAMDQLMTDVASGRIVVDTRERPLSEIGAAWAEPGRQPRLVFIP